MIPNQDSFDAVIIEQSARRARRDAIRLALFNADGSPFSGGGGGSFIDAIDDTQYLYAATADPVELVGPQTFKFTDIDNVGDTVTVDNSGASTKITPNKSGLYYVHYQLTFDQVTAPSGMYCLGRFESSGYNGMAAHELRVIHPTEVGTDVLQAGLMYLNENAHYQLKGSFANVGESPQPTFVYANVAINPVLL